MSETLIAGNTLPLPLWYLVRDQASKLRYVEQWFDVPAAVRKLTEVSDKPFLQFLFNWHSLRTL